MSEVPLYRLFLMSEVPLYSAGHTPAENRPKVLSLSLLFMTLKPRVE